MKFYEKNGIQWLEFEKFSAIEKFQQATLLRHGGVSSGSFATLNLSDYLNDETENVLQNRRLVQERLSIPRLVWCHQRHGINITEVFPDSETPIMDCDALITNSPGVGLMIQHADCQAVVMYDPVHHAVANIHCGWRGNVQNIFEKVVDKLQKRYGSQPEDLLVGISPSLGPEASQFINYRTEFPEAFWKYEHKPLYFDLWAISDMQLRGCGVRPENIEIARQCTYSDPDNFYSYRYNKIRGGHGTIVMLHS